MLEAIETGTVVEFLTADLLHLRAGTAAAAGEQWKAAEEHYEIALRQAQELPHKIARPEVRRWYAQMLRDRNAAGDRDKARTMLSDAIEMYQAIGMPRHV